MGEAALEETLLEARLPGSMPKVPDCIFATFAAAAAASPAVRTASLDICVASLRDAPTATAALALAQATSTADPPLAVTDAPAASPAALATSVPLAPAVLAASAAFFPASAAALVAFAAFDGIRGVAPAATGGDATVNDILPLLAAP
jgi:hypothetical protein